VKRRDKEKPEESLLYNKGNNRNGEGMFLTASAIIVLFSLH
jgi:hypothetical protein